MKVTPETIKHMAPASPIELRSNSMTDSRTQKETNATKLCVLIFRAV